MPLFECIEFNIEAGIAYITLNRPNAANAMNLALVTDLAQAAMICDQDKSVKVVLLTANGRMFSAGGDLKAFASFSDQVEPSLKAIVDQLHKAVSLFSRMSAVLVIAVNGSAAGAGFSLAVAGDYVLAADSAKFTMAYTGAGLSPDGGSTYFLPRLIGLRRAQELMLTNRTLSAREACDWGLVTQVVADEALTETAHLVARRLAAGPAGAHSAIKTLLLGSLRSGLEEQLEIEGRSIASLAGSADGTEGILAFTQKRKPDFL